MVAENDLGVTEEHNQGRWSRESRVGETESESFLAL